MLSARCLRGAPRAARAVRPRNPVQRRFQSTASSSAASNGSSSHIAAGLAGGIAGSSLLYGIYLMTPSGRMTSKINKAAKEADKKYQAAAATLKNQAPSTDEAIDRLKQFCYSYVAWIPGGRAYVDTAFEDLASIRERNSDEVDELVSETYKRIQDIAASGLSMESLSKTYDALGDLTQKLGRLAGNTADQILENHPQLKDKIGGPIDQLKQMGEQYGPEAKKMVDETWEQVSDALSGGFSAESFDKVRRLIEEKVQKMQQLGEQAWEKGLEQAKPYLDKNPKVKQLIEDNADALKTGNATALFKEVKSAVESGDVGKLEDYVKKAASKAKESTGGGGSGSSLMSSGPLAGLGQLVGGGKVQENIEVLSNVVTNHSDEGKKLLEETKEDLKKLLESKAKKAQKILDSAKE